MNNSCSRSKCFGNPVLQQGTDGSIHEEAGGKVGSASENTVPNCALSDARGVAQAVSISASEVPSQIGRITYDAEKKTSIAAREVLGSGLSTASRSGIRHAYAVASAATQA